MVLEFMDGGSLADLITKQGPQTEGNERRLAHSHTRTYPYPYPSP